ncbi:hypothetical protein A2W24_02010 [Microgenomates group bacterium RBG_16_45_19]|nr:MAG: hypothetical protein A2W24_02010 [Microgenomates group bacterium RBG_16_45_19]
MVVQGDNLWRLAEKYYSNGFKFIEIAKANGINQPDQIDIGQKLVIPTVTAASQLLRISDKPITYTVVKGDNLWRIAFRFYGDGRVFGQIVRVNAELIRQPDLIEPGWQLTLPPLEPIS